LGCTINVAALIFLSKKKLKAKNVTYRIALFVSTVHLIIISVVVGTTTTCDLFHSDNYFLFFVGLLPLFPKIVCDVAVVLIIGLTFVMWELTPASCILQCLALC
ncbi:hypothetical protein PFISCL1PPCAC_20761, partial [Pristionchus fissidentatus]